MFVAAAAATPGPAAHDLDPTENVVRARTLAVDRAVRTPAWRAFADGEGRGWQLRVDPGTGRPRGAMGRGIPVPAVADAADAERAVRGLFSRWPSLTGVPAAALRLRAATYVGTTDTWYVDFERVVGGVPVAPGGASARIRGGKIIALGLETWPDASLSAAPALTRSSALAIARAHGPAPDSEHQEGTARLVITPTPAEGGVTFPLHWELRSRTVDPPGRWVVLVNARTGTIDQVSNEVRWLDGVLSGEHDTRIPDGNLITSPLAFLALQGSGGAEVVTGADGSFSVADDQTWSALLEGPYIRVTNEAGAEGSLAVVDSAPFWDATATTQAELDSWVFLNRVTAWALRFSPDHPLLAEQIRSKVNISVTCNGFYDGAVNFGVAGDGCNNLGQIADINYHEWGHAFHEYGLLSGSVNPTMGEGFADVVAMHLTLDSTVAPSFRTDGKALREMATDKVYPTDMTSIIYKDSLIYAGAAWDLLGVLQARYGEGADEFGEAWAVSSRLQIAAMRGGPDLLSVYDEYALADDDDGDVSNGSPHLCEIVETFGAHGLGPLSDPFPVRLLHEPLGNQAAGGAIEVTGSVLSIAPGCVEGVAEAVEVVWSIDGGETWTTEAASVTGEGFLASIPALPDGTVLEYYLLARGIDRDEVTLPAGRWAPYTLYVGELEELWCEDFADGDGGFTHALSGSGGWDDWAFGYPTGEGGDPVGAFSGDNAWGNDIGIGSDDGEYPRGATSALSSPAIAVGDAGRVVVQYRRWLGIDDNAADQANVHANGLIIWTNHAASAGVEPTEDAEWMLHTLVVDLGGAETLSLDWQLVSDADLVFAGWNIDDVCVYRSPAGDTGDTADSGLDSADDSAPDDSGKEEEPDCGCASGSPVTLLLWGAGAAAVTRRRRRDQT